MVSVNVMHFVQLSLPKQLAARRYRVTARRRFAPKAQPSCKEKEKARRESKRRSRDRGGSQE